MKKTLFALLFCFLAYHTAQAQGTTLEEYNYCTKGYKVQVESGLDMKKGYYIGQIQKFPKYETVIVTFIELYRSGETPNEAGTLAATIMKVNLDGNDIYLCIPNKDADNDLWLKYFKHLDIFTTYARSGIIKALSVFMSKYEN